MHSLAMLLPLLVGYALSCIGVAIDEPILARFSAGFIFGAALVATVATRKELPRKLRFAAMIVALAILMISGTGEESSPIMIGLERASQWTFSSFGLAHLARRWYPHNSIY